jgi:hypothetical protein
VSITNKEILRCQCGQENAVMVVKSLNAGRHPHLRDQVLRRELHRWECSACKRTLFLDSDFFWFDWHRKEFIGVFPTSMRGRSESCEQVLAETFEFTMKEQAPQFVKEYGVGFFVRTVFGVEELREKLVIHEAGFDDFLVEILKMELLLRHPELVERGVVTLRLDKFQDDGLLLLVPEAHDDSRFGNPPLSIGVERDVYDSLVPHRDELLRERGVIVRGSHISLRSLADAIASDPHEAVVP